MPLPVRPVVVTTTAPTGAQPAKSDKLFDQTGTGFLVSANGHVVANQHVVDGCVGDIKGNLTGEAPARLRVVSSDETNDLALLQVPGTFKEVAKSRTEQSGPAIVSLRSAFRFMER